MREPHDRLRLLAYIRTGSQRASDYAFVSTDISLHQCTIVGCFLPMHATALGDELQMLVTLFFKPTLAYGHKAFRPTKQGALSYFVGGDPDFSEDTGFALKHWVKVWYDNNTAENGIQIHGELAITMGNVYLVDAAGEKVMVDKTFVFRRCADGRLRLCVHKSALPYTPDR